MTSPNLPDPALPVKSLSGSPTGDRGRVEADARARQLPVTFVARARATSLDDAAELLGISAGEIVKSLVVKRHDGSFLFALIPGDRQISWAKLRAVVGVNKLTMPDAAVALAVTGYERGTITPLGSRTVLPIFADHRMVGKRIALGAGAHGLSVFVEADALVAAYDAVVADISD